MENNVFPAMFQLWYLYVMFYLTVLALSDHSLLFSIVHMTVSFLISLFRPQQAIAHMMFARERRERDDKRQKDNTKRNTKTTIMNSITTAASRFLDKATTGHRHRSSQQYVIWYWYHHMADLFKKTIKMVWHPASCSSPNLAPNNNTTFHKSTMTLSDDILSNKTWQVLILRKLNNGQLLLSWQPKQPAARIYQLEINCWKWQSGQCQRLFILNFRPLGEYIQIIPLWDDHVTVHCTLPSKYAREREGHNK